MYGTTQMWIIIVTGIVIIGVRQFHNDDKIYRFISVLLIH